MSHSLKTTTGILWADTSVVKYCALSGIFCPTRNYPGPNAIVLPLQGNIEEKTGKGKHRRVLMRFPGLPKINDEWLKLCSQRVVSSLPISKLPGMLAKIHFLCLPKKC